MDPIAGGCSCGQLRYLATGEPVNVRVCHCRMCQKAIGAAFNARVMYRQDQVKITGVAAIHHTSDSLRRGFCGRCGATVFSARDSAGLIGLTAGSLDDPSWFRPTMHIWTDSRQPWVTIEDGIETWPQAPPA